MSFGEILTKLRKEKGMSQEELANNLNVSRQAVSKWESNSSYPETEKIVAICKLFNSSMDELIGLKDGKKTSENKTINIINEYFDKFIKGIKMFYSMTFKQKIKCIIEMGFYCVFLLIIFLVSKEILIEIIRKLLYLLPGELLYILLQVFEGIYYLLFIIFAIYVLVKLYKVRYLDYYENYLQEKEDASIEVKEIKEEKRKKISIKEEKIIIRDNDEFKPFTWLKKCITIFMKFFAILFSVCLIVTFVLLIAFIIFTLYFIDSGILILYVALGLFGGLIGVYVFIELLVKYIFNMEQKPKRLFIMFIVAMLVVGISCGLFGCELATFKILDNPEYNHLVYKENIKMQDDLIITSLKYSNTEIIYEDRDDILIELYGTDLNISPIEIVKEDIYCKNDYSSETKHYNMYTYYNYYDYFNGNTINDGLRNLLKTIKNKELVDERYFFEVVPKIYISKENYEILSKNVISENHCSYYMDSYSLE